MRSRIQNVGIAWEITTKHSKKVERLVWKIVRHGAMDPHQADLLFQIFIGRLPDRFLQQRKTLGAVSALRHGQSTLAALNTH